MGHRKEVGLKCLIPCPNCCDPKGLISESREGGLDAHRRNLTGGLSRGLVTGTPAETSTEQGMEAGLRTWAMQSRAQRLS